MKKNRSTDFLQLLQTLLSLNNQERAIAEATYFQTRNESPDLVKQILFSFIYFYFVILISMGEKKFWLAYTLVIFKFVTVIF